MKMYQCPESASGSGIRIRLPRNACFWIQIQWILAWNTSKSMFSSGAGWRSLMEGGWRPAAWCRYSPRRARPQRVSASTCWAGPPPPPSPTPPPHTTPQRPRRPSLSSPTASVSIWKSESDVWGMKVFFNNGKLKNLFRTHRQVTGKQNFWIMRNWQYRQTDKKIFLLTWIFNLSTWFVPPQLNNWRSRSVKVTEIVACI